MKIWQWFGWDTKSERTKRIKHSNFHSTIQIALICLACAVTAYACSAVGY